MLALVSFKSATVNPVPCLIQTAIGAGRKVELFAVRFAGVNPEMHVRVLRVLVDKPDSSRVGQNGFEPFPRHLRRFCAGRPCFERHQGSVMRAPFRLRLLAHLRVQHQVLPKLLERLRPLYLLGNSLRDKPANAPLLPSFPNGGRAADISHVRAGRASCADIKAQVCSPARHDTLTAFA